MVGASCPAGIVQQGIFPRVLVFVSSVFLLSVAFLGLFSVFGNFGHSFHFWFPFSIPNTQVTKFT
jgi:hypothetical protein